MSKSILAWHFLESSRKTRWGDTEVKVGETIKYDGALIMCQSGLHASLRPIDALKYAPGPIVCRVRLSGTIEKGKDKCVASERTCIAMADATDLLLDISRRYALQVIHLWDAPSVVREFLETGNESLRHAARAAAEAAAWAAGAAAGAALAAAGAAARAAAWAAGAAAGDASWAAGAAAWDASWAAAWDAARAAAGDASWAAAWDAANATQNAELERRLKELLHCD